MIDNEKRKSLVCHFSPIFFIELVRVTEIAKELDRTEKQILNRRRKRKTKIQLTIHLMKKKRKKMLNMTNLEQSLVLLLLPRRKLDSFWEKISNSLTNLIKISFSFHFFVSIKFSWRNYIDLKCSARMPWYGSSFSCHWINSQRLFIFSIVHVHSGHMEHELSNTSYPCQSRNEMAYPLKSIS